MRQPRALERGRRLARAAPFKIDHPLSDRLKAKVRGALELEKSRLRFLLGPAPPDYGIQLLVLGDDGLQVTAHCSEWSCCGRQAVEVDDQVARGGRDSGPRGEDPHQIQRIGR